MEVANKDQSPQRKATFCLGHPEYHPCFGFVLASRFGLRCPWDGVPEEVFMALELAPGALRGVAGVVRYRDEFDEAV